MLAIIAPGQGSQTPGMFNSWVTNPVFHELLSTWSMRIDVDLIRLGTTADADEIKDTANAQPLIVAASLLEITEIVVGAVEIVAASVRRGSTAGVIKEV